MNGNDRISVGAPIPKIGAVEAGKPFVVNVTWRDGRREQIDVSPIIMTYKVFRPLRDDPTLFAAVSVDEHGSAIVWSDDMDLANYTLERLAQVSRPMSRDDFKDWMKRHGLTLDTAAPVLGISRRQVAAFSSGEKTIDRSTKLACRGYDAIMGAQAAE
jgi:Protein of unknown function (DUF2442).